MCRRISSIAHYFNCTQNAANKQKDNIYLVASSINHYSYIVVALSNWICTNPITSMMHCNVPMHCRCFRLASDHWNNCCAHNLMIILWIYSSPSNISICTRILLWFYKENDRISDGIEGFPKFRILLPALSACWSWHWLYTNTFCGVVLIMFKGMHCNEKRCL